MNTDNLNTDNLNTTEEKGNTMNTTTQTHDTMSDENKRGYWAKPYTLTVCTADGNKSDSVRYVPFLAVVGGYVPEYVADKWDTEHARTLNPTANDTASGCVKTWDMVEREALNAAVLVKAPTFYPDGARLDGINDAAYHVAPNDKGKYSRADACGKLENGMKRGASVILKAFLNWAAADAKRDELNAADAKRRAKERKQTEIDAIATALIAARWEPEAAYKRARKLYADANK